MSRRLSRAAYKGSLLPLGLAGIYVLHGMIGERYGVESYGKFSLVLAAASVLGVVVTAGMPAAAQRLIPRYLVLKQPDEIWRFITFGLWWTFVALSVLMLSAAGLEFFLPGMLPPQTWHAIPLVTAATAIWLWQRYVCLGYGMVSTALVPREIIFSAGAICYLSLVDTATVEQFFVPYSLMMICACLPVLVIATRKAPGKPLAAPWSGEARGWLVKSRNFLLTTLFQLGLNSWDIILLGLMSSLEETGRYAAATRLAMSVMIITRVLNTLYGHRFAGYHASEAFDAAKLLFDRLRRWSVMLSLVALGVMAVLYGPIIEFIGRDYSSIGPLVVLLAVTNALVVSTGPVLQFLNMSGADGEVAKSVARWSAVSIAGNIALIPFLGADGAAAVYIFANLGMRFQLLSVKKARFG